MVGRTAFITRLLLPWLHYANKVQILTGCREVSDLRVKFDGYRQLLVRLWRIRGPWRLGDIV